MICKKVPMRVPRKSSFSQLTKYLLDEQEKVQRVGDVFISNCQSDDPVWAALEIEATQGLNTRALSDKTYHMIISFPPGENPSEAVLRDIEKTMADALGFGEHQRITVVHRDTEHLHMHVAINKIHPESKTLHDPYKDHKTIAAACIALEAKHGLEKVNHGNVKTPGQNRADDMENMAGIQSLLSYAREVLPELQSAETWEQLHRSLAAKGLQIKPQGAGLIVTDDVVAVKASNIDRTMSKGALEKRLGAYQPSATPLPKNTQQYTEKPLQGPMASDLYALYTEQRHTYALQRKAGLSRISADHAKEVSRLKDGAKLKRQLLRLVPNPLVRQLARKQINADLQRGLANASAKAKKERQDTYRLYTRPAWQDWLKQQAVIGSSTAAEMLRKRKARSVIPQNSLYGDDGQSKTGQVPGAPINSVTSKGSLVYNVSNTPIRDNGQTLHISRWPTTNGLLAGLQMAIYKFGPHLRVDGDDKFKTAVAKSAAQHKVAVSFADPEMERLRLAYINNPLSKETYERTKPERSGLSRDVGRAGPAKRTSITTSGDPDQRTSNGVGRRSTVQQLHVAAVGTEPPPTSQNRLRQLSSCGLVFDTNRTEVLLPGDVSGLVGQQETQRDHIVRRPATGDGVKNNARAAIDKYVNERNETRNKVFDISQHRRYTEFDSGTAVYQGIRQVDGVSLALLAKDQQVLVMAVDAKTAGRLRRLKVGAEVQISKTGVVTNKGRSR